MGIREIDASEIERVDLSVSGDLTVIGWEKSTISYATDDDSDRSDERHREVDRGLFIRTEGDVRLHLPHRLGLRLERVNGDARIRGVQGGIDAGDINGDLDLVEIGGTIHVRQCGGDVNIRRAHGEISVDQIPGDLHASEVQGHLRFGQVGGDVSIEDVVGDVVLSEAVGGDATIRGVNGNVHATNIGGDLTIAESTSVHIDNVGGDLALQDTQEEVAIDNVGGDATVAKTRGRITVDNIGGNFTGQDLTGGLSVDRIGGRARLSTAFTPGQEYAISCGGSATIILTEDPANASLSFELRRADGGHVEVDGPVDEDASDSGIVHGRWGAGEATLRVQSGGGLRLLVGDRGHQSDNFVTGLFEGIGEEIQSAFSAFAASGGFELERQIRDKTDRAARRAEETVRRVAERAERQAQEAARRAASEAEKGAQRAAERAQRTAERAARQAERHTGWHWNWRGQSGGGWVPQPPSPAPPAPPPVRPRVNEEERLLILQMVSDGTISSKEAARLLEVLGS